MVGTILVHVYGITLGTDIGTNVSSYMVPLLFLMMVTLKAYCFKTHWDILMVKCLAMMNSSNWDLLMVK